MAQRSPSQIRITKKLFQQLRKLRNTQEARLFLLGANRSDTLTTVRPLKRGGGCDFLPAITSDELSKNYTRLYKKGIIPRGFVYVDTYVGMDDFEKYSYKEIGDVNDLAGQLPAGSFIIFVDTQSDCLNFLLTRGETGKVKEIPYKITT